MRVLPAGRIALPSALVVLLLAACGSQLDPGAVAQVGGGAEGGATSSGLLAGDPAAADGGAAGLGGSGAPGLDGGAGSVPGSPVAAGGGASGPGGAGGSSGSPAGGGGPAPEGDAKAGACEGFENTTGITDDTIVLANAVDLSGPVPGLMQASQDAVRAYAAYFNATSDICGRKLEVLALDSRTDAAADQVAYSEACEKAFAAVGSMSAFDAGGARTAEQCGLPDLRAASASLERSACSTCFGAMSLRANEFENAVPDWVKRNFPAGAKRAAYVWVNAGAVPANANYQADAMEKRGLDFVVRQGIDVSEFNYAPYVQQLRDAKVEYVQFLGATAQAVRMVQTMRQQGWAPDLFMMTQPMYEPSFLEVAGEAAEDAHIFITHVPFEEAGRSREVQTYLAWLEQVRPGAAPTSYGLFSWSAARLFVQEAVRLGGRLTRDSLVAALRQVEGWTGNDAHAPQNVGSERTSECWRFIKVAGGRWVPAGSRDYTCTGTTVVPE